MQYIENDLKLKLVFYYVLLTQVICNKDWAAKKVTIFNSIVHLVKTSENILFFYLHFTWLQSHYREVPRWEISMEQELRFGQDMGRMANFPAFIASKSFDL
jgi:hypothetical protein